MWTRIENGKWSPIGIVLLMSILMMGFPMRGEATTFTVNSTTDAVDADTADTACETANGNGICTLRAAIQQANALSGPNTILVPAGTYTITLAGANENFALTGDLEVRDDLTLSGEGTASTIIDGGALDRVFQIDPGNAGISADLERVTIQNGISPSMSDGGGSITRGLSR